MGTVEGVVRIFDFHAEETIHDVCTSFDRKTKIRFERFREILAISGQPCILAMGYLLVVTAIVAIECVLHFL